MSIVRWDPIRELEEMQRRFLGAGVFNPQATGSNETLARAEWQPAVDIAETQEAFTLHAELPDVKKEDIKLSVHDGVLTLTGERRFDREERPRSTTASSAPTGASSGASRCRPPSTKTRSPRPTTTACST